VVLVNEIVAVHHVPPEVRPELHDQPDRLTLAEVHDVLRPALVRRGRTPVAVEDLEVDEMDVHRMEPPVGVVPDRPDLDIVQPRVRFKEGEAAVDDVFPRPAVHRPLTALALEVHESRRLRLGGVERETCQPDRGCHTNI